MRSGIKATVTGPLTTEELLALPQNGMDRWLIAGELRERPMVLRNRFHAYTMTCLATALDTWRDSQPEPRGQVLTGDAGIRLRRDPDTTFGVDVIYVSADVLAQQTGSSTLIEGVPTLAVEILSPSDTIEDVNDKIDAFLEAGVPLVWIIDARRRTVTVHRPDGGVEVFTVQHDLSGEPQLPGFSVAVRELFE